MIKKAVIVAAGMSQRLLPRTKDKPKCLLSINHQTLLERSICFLKACGVDKIGVVLGYQSQCIIDCYSDDIFPIFNPFYEHCNNMASLWFAQSFVDNDPFIYLHSDVIFDQDILVRGCQQFSDQKCDISLFTCFGQADEEAMKIKADSSGYLIQSSKDIPLEEADGEWIGLAMIRQSDYVFERIQGFLLEGKLSVYDTHVFNFLAKNRTVYCTSIGNKNWMEIDTEVDFQEAKRLFEI